MENSIPAHSASRSALLAGQIKRDWWWVTISLIVFTAALSLLRFELSLERLDFTFYDFQASNAFEYHRPKNTVLIIIDDKSINEVGYWPWRRSEYAALIERLHLAKAVGLDIIFHDKNPFYSADDVQLAYAMEAHGRVVLPTAVSADRSRIHKPLNILLESAHSTGFINAYPDKDGVVRRAHLFFSLPEEPLHFHFTLAMLLAGGDEGILKQSLQHPLGSTRLIPFLGPPGHFESYAFSDVIQGNIPPSVFKDRYVLVGAWSSGLGDFYPTPLSSTKQTSMSGVEILANQLENTILNNWIRTGPPLINAFFSIIPVLFICFILRHLTPRRAILSTCLVLIIIFIGNWFFLHILSLWIPPTAGLIGTVLAYPIWYWRSQETVLRFINNEISQMREQDPELRQALAGRTAPNTLPARLSHLHKAIELLREAQQRKEETLRFISHDMRSPQNSILALVKMQRQNELTLSLDQLLTHVENYASTTLELVDDFMDLARVEAMELEMEPMYLNDLLVEVCDDAWVRAQAKQITVVFDEPEQGVWVNVAPSLFKRALSNLIDNAIKYSSNQTQVTCLVKNKENHVQIVIQDQGWGIPKVDLPYIFQPFKRAHATKTDGPKGSGLGLAFVHAVILRHFGEIRVNSKENVGTRFIIQLPVIPEPGSKHH